MTWGSIWPKVGFRISGLGFSVEGLRLGHLQTFDPKVSTTWILEP